MAAIRPTGEGVEIAVWVVPGARRTEVRGLHGDAVRVRVAVPPAGGRANDAVVSLIGSVLDAPTELIRGRTSRRKLLQVTGVSPAEARRKLGV